MTSTIITKNSSTASSVPLAADLTQGELAVNVTDKKLYSKDSGGSVVKLVGSLGNQEANAAAITGGTINGTAIGGTTAAAVSATTLTTSSTVTLNGGTANGLAYLNASKVLTSGSAITFNGSTLATSNANASFTSGSATTAGVITSGAAVTQGVIQFGSGQTTYNIQGGPDYVGNVYNVATGSSHQWAIATSEQMRLTSTGLGIGTSSPAQKLDVYGTGMKVNNASYVGYLGSGSTFASVGGGAASDFAVRSDNALVFATGGPYLRATLDSAGNLGLGVTPSAFANGFKSLQVNGPAIYSNGYNNLNISTNVNGGVDGSGNGGTYQNNDLAARYQQIQGVHKWYNAASGTAGNAISFTQAMTLDASGNLLVGQTSTGQQNSNSFSFQPTTGGGGIGIVNHASGSASGNAYFAFAYNGTGIGSITQSGTTAVLYNVTSDYRLKTVVGAVTGHGERIDALEPIEYEWKSNGSRTRGFLAHKFQEVYADSVTGTKDAVDADGNPVYQAMQAGSSEVIADLVAEIKSLRQRLAAANL